MSKKTTTTQTITPEQMVAAIETMTESLTRSFDEAADRIGAALTVATSQTIKVDGRQAGTLVQAGLHEAAGPRPLWADISTDRSRPTLAKVGVFGSYPTVRHWWIDDDRLWARGTEGGELLVCLVGDISSVELLHAVTPELLDHALNVYREAGREDTNGYRTLLALATGAES